jgi:hypothetical protein
MKTIRIVRGCVHVPTAAFAPTVETIASLSIPTGDRSVTVVKRGETVTLSDAAADRLIVKRITIEVTPIAIDAHLDTGTIEIHGVDIQADGYVVSRLNRGEVK